MPLLELDDFDIHSELTSVLNGTEQNELAFCPMFVFLICWAAESNFLGLELKSCEVFSKYYPKLRQGEISFEKFVLDVLDGKLTESNFSDEVSEFVKDYIECEGYVVDLTRLYNTNVGDLPSDFKEFDMLCKFINMSRKNYGENKLNYPDLVVFSDPEQLKREQANRAG